MRRLEWTRIAADQFERSQACYQALDPIAATLMARRIIAALQRLRAEPGPGRPGRVTGTREWVVGRTPYLLIHRVEGEALQVPYVRHEAQDRLAKPE